MREANVSGDLIGWLHGP